MKVSEILDLCGLIWLLCALFGSLEVVGLPTGYLTNSGWSSVAVMLLLSLTSFAVCRRTQVRKKEESR